MTGIRTTCPYCGVGCGVIVSPEGVKGDSDHPANFGRLCSKGSALAETLDDSRRLRRPQINGRETSWDLATSVIASQFQSTIAQHGPDSVAFYVSGQFLTEDYYVANKLMKGFIGSGNIDTNSRLCMASSVAGHVRAFGEDVVPGTYEDFEQADLVVLVGSNTAWCHPVLFQRFAAARAVRGTRLVVIDPRRTATCEGADLHLPLAIGTDVALFAGLLVHLADTGQLDQRWAGKHTTGLDDALRVARECAGTVEQVAAVTKLSPEEIGTFFRLFAATERVVTVYSQGVNQSSAGTDKVNAIINCHLATGRIGRPGMGPFSVTGQPNAMGGREVGGLANQLAAHMGFDRPDDVDRVRRFWRAPSIATRPGLKAVELFDAVSDGRVKALWIAATNPAASMPRADLVRRALETCPFVVVSDCWPTDTTKYAHVLLPAAGWGEKDGTVTNSERRISRQRAFRSPPSDAKPDWWMFAKVGRRMGWEDAFSYDGPASIFREHAALSSFENNGNRAFDIGLLADLSTTEYDAFQPVQWPLSGTSSPKEGRFFAEGGFLTPDGKARFAATPYRPVAAKTSRRQPFLLNTGRIRDQWHTMTRTGLVPRLMSHQDEPLLELHPHDAGKLGLENGDLVKIDTEHGSAILRAKSNPALRVGEIFAPMHWSDDFTSAGPIAKLVGGICDPLSGQPEMKATAARLAPVPTLWSGILLSYATRLDLGGSYSVRIPIAQGQLYELRGWDPLPTESDMPSWAERLLDHPSDAEWIEVGDRDRGAFRFASVVKGRLRACLLLTRDRQWPLPERDLVVPRLGAEFDKNAYEALFVLRESAADMPARDRKVCSCFSVGRSAIEKAIVDKRLTSCAQVGKALRAGTNCGSCIPEIEEILRDVHANVA